MRQVRSKDDGGGEMAAAATVASCYMICCCVSSEFCSMAAITAMLLQLLAHVALGLTGSGSSGRVSSILDMIYSALQISAENALQKLIS
jgi:hypothetical protein